MDFDTMVVMQVMSCDDAKRLMWDFVNNLDVQAGDRSANVGAYACRILGAEEERQSGGVVIECSGPGYVMGVAPGSVASMEQDPD
jgi:hypothetical protein